METIGNHENLEEKERKRETSDSSVAQALEATGEGCSLCSSITSRLGSLFERRESLLERKHTPSWCFKRCEESKDGEITFKHSCGFCFSMLFQTIGPQVIAFVCVSLNIVMIYCLDFWYFPRFGLEQGRGRSTGWQDAAETCPWGLCLGWESRSNFCVSKIFCFLQSVPTKLQTHRQILKRFKKMASWNYMGIFGPKNKNKTR